MALNKIISKISSDADLDTILWKNKNKQKKIPDISKDVIYNSCFHIDLNKKISSYKNKGYIDEYLTSDINNQVITYKKTYMI